MKNERKKEMKRKLVSVLLVMAMMGAAVTGCGNVEKNGGTSAEASTESTGDKTVLKVQLIGGFEQEDFTDPVSGEKLTGMHVVETEFEKQNPDIDVEFIYMGWDDYQKKTQAMMIGGEADVYQAPGISALAEQDLLEPLQPYIDEDGFDMSVYTEGQVEGWKVAGPEDEEAQIYGLPFIGDTRFIMYDKEIFDQWGVEYLTAEPTMEEILEKSEQMTGTNPETGEENYGIFYTGKDAADTVMNINEYYGGTWGEGIRSSEMSVNFNSDTMVQAIEDLKTLNEYAPEGVMAGQGGELFGTDGNNIAINLRCAPLNLKSIQTLGIEDNYGVSRLFINEEEGMGGMFAGSPFVIAKTSEVKDAAWEFMKFTSGEFFTEYFWNNQRAEGMPVTKSALELEGVKGEESVEAMFKTMETLWAPRYYYRSGQGRSILTTAVETAVLGGEDTKSTLDSAQKEIEEWIEVQ